MAAEAAAASVRFQLAAVSMRIAPWAEGQWSHGGFRFSGTHDNAAFQGKLLKQTILGTPCGQQTIQMTFKFFFL